MLKQRVLFLCALAFLVVAVSGQLAGWWSTLDAMGGDVLLRLDKHHRQPPQRILMVDIDQSSLDHPDMLDLAGNWPWGRAVHGELVDFLLARGVAAIAFDLIFSEPDVFRPESDAVLSRAAQDPRVFMPLVIAADGTASRLAALPAVMGVRGDATADPEAALPLIAPKALDPEGWRTGIINFLADDDQIGRRYWIDYPHRGWHLPSLPARLARAQGIDVPAAEAVTLHWYGQPFRRVSYHELFLAAQKSDPGPLPDLKDSLVIIGAAAPGLHDMRPTPLGATTLGPDILATLLGNLIDDDWLRPVSPGWNVLLMLLGVGGVFVLFRYRVNAARLAGGLGLLSVLAVGVAYLLLARNLQWLPFSALGAIWLAFAGAATVSYLRERSQRDHAVQMFSRFLDPNVVNSLTSGGALATAETGSSREITILFSDIRGFTTLSETRTPEEVVTLLNRYFDLQVEAIFAEGGTLDKFIGDAIMAFWNAPVATPDHAVRGVRAALGMVRQLEVFKAEMGEFGKSFDIGIGIHTGPAVVGFLGASQRLDYTAIGDTVNLGSRIEGLTKGVSRILVSEATMRACGDAFEFVDHGEFHVKGRVQPVRLFEPKERS